MSEKIILASQSPRRQQLLQQLGLSFKVHVADIDETPVPGMALPLVAEHLAVMKVKKIAPLYPHSAVIAADTVVILENKILGKPVDEQEAKEMLLQLSGKMHHVVSGVAVAFKGEIFSFSDTTEVHFSRLKENDIQYYVDHFKPLDKAGSYAIQEYIGMIGISQIVGDYYNVMGLPLHRLNALLRELNILEER